MERNPSLFAFGTSCRHSKQHPAIVLMAGVMLLAGVSGCYSYNPYGYGGNYMSPYGGMPPATVAPGGAIMQSPTGAYIAPGDFNTQTSPSQQPTQIVQPQQWQNSKSGPAPGAEVFERPKENTVPDYQDPNGGRGGALPSANQGEAEEFSPFESSQRTGEATDPSLARQEFDVADNSVTLGEPMADEDFAAPVLTKSVSSTKTLADEKQDLSTRPNPYAYESKKYGWLRGVVDFNEQDKSWHIIYSLNPDSGDSYGGDLTLIDHPNLKFLKTDDVVLVYGRIDTTVPDRFGKPSYRVKKIDRLIPRK